MISSECPNFEGSRPTFLTVECPICGNEFHLRESAMFPGLDMKTHCPYCQSWLTVRVPVRKVLQVAAIP